MLNIIIVHLIIKIYFNIDKISESIDITKRDYEPTVHNFGLPVVLMKIADRLNLANIINQVVDKRDQGLSVGDCYN